MADRTVMTQTEEAPVLLDDVMEEAAPPRRRRWPWYAAAGLIVAILLVGWLVLRNGDSAADDEPTAQLTTGEVVRTDLVEVTTYAGTLGRVAGDPVVAVAAGTVTSAAEVGDVVEQGEVLFAIDREPTVLLYGTSPAYRTIASSEGTVSISTTVQGTVTVLPEAGDILAQGDVAVVVDDEATFVLYGELPAWRTLEEGVDEGPDVQQLEQALVDLGYDPDETVDIDEDFTVNTENMVERWQEDVGAEEDGVVDLGEVVFLSDASEVIVVPTALGQGVGPGQLILEVGDGVSPSGDDIAQLETSLAALGFDPGPVDGIYTEATRSAVIEWQGSIGADDDGIVDLGEVVFLPTAIRISDRLTSVGSAVSPGTPVLAATGSDIVVTIDLPAEDQGLVAEGDPVTIELPDNSTTPGTVETVDTVASVSAQGEAVFEVTILLDDPAAAGGLDEAPVDVDIVTDRVDDVMAVPVTALLALAEGGYAVEVVEGAGGTRLVGVDPGFYAEGLVEIDSDGVDVGDRVVVP
ncbi:MAG TPA: peptidoglycan-binding protein [Acidimicrobiia bacterium]|nr:peptidoglycan-binding protein [Acidimicrobiia bacterium]